MGQGSENTGWTLDAVPQLFLSVGIQDDGFVVTFQTVQLEICTETLQMKYYCVWNLLQNNLGGGGR